jgi:hypothetical protein
LIDCELGQVVLWKGSPLRVAIEADVPSASEAAPAEHSIGVSVVSAETDAALEVGSFSFGDARRWVVEIPTEAVDAGTYRLAVSVEAWTTADLSAADDSLSEQFIVLERADYDALVADEEKESFAESSMDLTPDEAEEVIRGIWMDRLGSSRFGRLITGGGPFAGSPTNLRVRTDGESRAFRAVELAWIMDRLTALVQLLTVGEPWRAHLQARMDGFSALVWLSLVVDLPIPLSNRLTASLTDEQIGDVAVLRRLSDQSDLTYSAIPGASEFRLTFRTGGEAVAAERSATIEPPFAGSEREVVAETVAEFTAVDEYAGGYVEAEEGVDA